MDQSIDWSICCSPKEEKSFWFEKSCVLKWHYSENSIPCQNRGCGWHLGIKRMLFIFSIVPRLLWEPVLLHSRMNALDPCNGLTLDIFDRSKAAMCRFNHSALLHWDWGGIRASNTIWSCCCCCIVNIIILPFSVINRRTTSGTSNTFLFLHSIRFAHIFIYLFC